MLMRWSYPSVEFRFISWMYVTPVGVAFAYSWQKNGFEYKVPMFCLHNLGIPECQNYRFWRSGSIQK